MPGRLDLMLESAAFSAAAMLQPLQPHPLISRTVDRSPSFDDTLHSQERKLDSDPYLAKADAARSASQEEPTRSRETEPKDQAPADRAETDPTPNAGEGNETGDGQAKAAAQAASETDSRFASVLRANRATAALLEMKNAASGSPAAAELKAAMAARSAESAELKEAVVSRTAETQLSVVGVKSEQIALDRLGRDALPHDPPAPKPAVAVEKETPAARTPVEKKAEPVVEGQPREIVEAARHETRSESAMVRGLQEMKAATVPVNLTAAETPLPSIRVQQTLPGSSTAPQLQELREKVLARIESGVQAMLDRGEGRMTLRLQPPELGRVAVEIQPGENGMEIRVSTENLAVREVVLAGLDQLKSNLQAAGLEVRNLSVEVGNSRDFYQEQAGNRNSERRRRGSSADGTAIAAGGETGGSSAAQTLQFYLGRRINLLI